MVSKVLIGAWRSCGSFESEDKETQEKRTIEYDNINLVLATFRGRGKLGFDLPKKTVISKDGEKRQLYVDPVKIRTEDFKELTGVDPDLFLENFEEQYMFHKVKITGEENDYGRFDVEAIDFSQDTCFELQKREEERLAALEAESAGDDVAF